MLGLLVGALIVLAACSPRRERAVSACLPGYESWVDVVRAQASRAMAPEDVYKLVHQGLAGPGHAAPSRDAAAAWLEAEITGLRDGAGAIIPLRDEPLLVPIRPDSSIVRVNLRPWLAAGGDPEVLLNAFLESARAIQPSPERLAADFEGVTACLLGAALDGDLPFDSESLRTMFAEAREAGFPARHHSQGYENANHPAYRVVERSRLFPPGPPRA